MHPNLKRLFALLMALALVAAACGGGDTEAATDDTRTEAGADDGEGALAGSEEGADDGEGALAGSEDGADDGEGALDGAVSHEDASEADLEIWQTDLNAVGCWAGAVDGTLGPRTEAAIIAFQTAKGLEADGLLGPITKSALEDAVAAGEIVCEEGTADDGEGAMAGSEDGADDGDGAMDGAAVATFSAADVTVDLSITVCENPTESTLSLAASEGSNELIVNATDGAGDITFFDDSGEWTGSVESVSVGDAGNIAVTGTISQPAGGDAVPFEVSGSCAG